MRRLLLILLIALTCPVPAEAEPISVRCDGSYFREPQPYFMTFDIEKRHFVYERAGGNLITVRSFRQMTINWSSVCVAREGVSCFPSIASIAG